MVSRSCWRFKRRWDGQAAGRLGRAALVTAAVAADACVTDTLRIAHEWAGDLQTDVPSQLRFGPSYETWQYLLRRIDDDGMSFLDKLHFGLEVIFAEFPCEQSTVDEIQKARQLRNQLVHLHSLKESPKWKGAHEVLFEPNRVIKAAADAVSAVECLIDEMDEFFSERWTLARSFALTGVSVRGVLMEGPRSARESCLHGFSARTSDIGS